ncbi:MAG: WYL domain-containing protein, partial [Firmicutes bacterium]|nr:WYL domain-containing protein [Bacillota bacterium]
LVLIQDDETEKGPKYFRVDLIKDIVISDEKISISRKEAKLDNIKHIVYAYSGEPGMVELLCDRTGLRYCIDKFGKDITVEPKDGRYRVVVTAAAEGMVYWALQFIKHVEVVKPDSLRGKIKDALKESKY